MKTLTLLFSLIVFTSYSQTTAQSEDIAAIKNILTKQQEAWSNQDLEGFMEGYWKSDSLTYYSGGKVTQGWQTTLDNYKKRYPTAKETGELNFEIDNINKISEDAFWVMGQYFLSSESGDANGTFMIIFKRIDGEWKIIGDSSC